MRRGLVAYGVGVVGIGTLVYAAGLALAQPGGRGDVAAGVLVAVAFQLLMLAVAALAFPGSSLAAYGVGMLGRLLLVIVSALVVVPAARLEPAPFLYSLVTVLFATTLLEPVAAAAGARNQPRR